MLTGYALVSVDTNREKRFSAFLLKEDCRLIACDLETSSVSMPQVLISVRLLLIFNVCIFLEKKV